MALPFFTDKNSNVYTFSKGRFLPSSEPIKPQQLVGKAGGGQVKITTLGDVEQFYNIVVNRITAAKRDELLAWFANTPVNYKEFAFTFTDEDAVAVSVRLWSDVLDFPLSKGVLYNLKFVLRKELT
jgi:hypothetical protein